MYLTHISPTSRLYFAHISLQAAADEKLPEKLAVLAAEQRAAEEVFRLSGAKWEAEREQLQQRIAQLEAQVC